VSRPFGRYAFGSIVRRSGVQLAPGGLPVQADQHGRAVGPADRLDPFGRRAQDQARHAEPGGLALHPAGIGHDRRGVELQREGGSVALGFDHRDSCRQPHPGRLQGRPGPRVERQDDGRSAAASARIAAQARIAAGSRFSARWTVAYT